MRSGGSGRSRLRSLRSVGGPRKQARNVLLHALVVTLVHSRYQYVWITFRQDLSSLILGLEEAWSSSEGSPDAW